MYTKNDKTQTKVCRLDVWCASCVVECVKCAVCCVLYCALYPMLCVVCTVRVVRVACVVCAVHVLYSKDSLIRRVLIANIFKKLPHAIYFTSF